MNPKNQEDDFYAEVDKSRVRGSCCTWQTMVIFFVALIVISSIVTIYSINRIKKINVPLRKIIPSRDTLTNISAKFNVDASNPNLDLTMTSEELTAQVASGISTHLFTIDNMQIIVQEKDLLVNGKLEKPLKSDLEIICVPSVQDNRIKLTVTKMTAGKLPLPGMLRNEVANSLNKIMDDNFAQIYAHYNVESINLTNDQMEIIGKGK